MLDTYQWPGGIPSGTMMGVVSDRLIAEQIAYYRQRTDEYDETAYGHSAVTSERIEEIVDGLPPAKSILELACGTGVWTEVLARRTDDLTALDSSPESLSIARSRCPLHVRLVCADVLRWLPDRRYNLIFFAFWLSHVPTSRLEPFFGMLRPRLAPGGEVAFVDEHVSLQSKEQRTTDPEVVRRTLSDGSSHRVVKNFIDPPKLIDHLDALGWSCDVSLDDRGWVIGQAMPKPES